MNYVSKFGTKALMLLFVGMMMNFHQLQADELESPLALKAMSDFGNDIPENFFYLEWKYDADELEEIDGFKVYKAPGITQNTDDFELFEELEIDDSRLDYYGNRVAAMLQTFDSAMNYSFYVTAYLGSDESEKSNINYARYRNQNTNYVKITNYFPETIAVGEETVYTPEVETDFPDPEYAFELIFHDGDEIEGMELDEETGEITWTPEEGGYYFFGLSLEVTNADYLQTAAKFRVYVSECSEQATITLNITDEDGNQIEHGKAILRSMKDAPNQNYSYHVMFSDGEAVFNDVEKGNYILGVMASGYFEYWYEGKTDFINADPFAVDCADELVFDIELAERVEYNISITNEFETTLKLNEEYVFTPEVETNYPDPEFEFDFFSPYGDEMPEGMEFDDETGAITWTPEEAGFYEFGIEVKVEDAYYVFARKMFRVNVTECDDFAVLNLNAIYDDDEPVDSAFAYLISIEEDRNRFENYYEAVVVNGEANFESVDKGTYYLAVVGHGFYEYWYEDANNYWEATPIEIDCGDEISLDAVIEKKEMPEFYSISGTVTDEETGEPIEFATVSLISERNEKRNNMNGTITDENGYYEFYQVPDNMSYIVRAEKGSFILESDSLFGQSYLPEYYDNVTDISEATLLELESDVTGIDFTLTPVPEYENSISGTVKGEDDFDISEGFVVGFLTETSDMNLQHLYYGVTSIIEDGEFTLEKLIPGEYILLAFDAEMQYMPGYYVENDVATMKWRKATSITVDENSEIQDIAILLQDRENMWGGGIVKGRIKKGKESGIVMGEDPTAEPLNGAMIFLADENGNVFKAGESDEQGRFSLENINYGTYKLVADKVGFDTYETTIVIDENENIIETDIEMQQENLTSVDDMIDFASSAVYPNPASDVVNVSFSAYENNSVIKLTDVMGNELLTKDISTTTGINNIELNVSEYAAGAYFVIIKSGEKQISLPVIIK